MAVCCGLVRVLFRTFTKQRYDQIGVAPKMGRVDQWLQLPEIAKMFGLSEESIKRLAKTHGLPLRRITPFATPGSLESELVNWLKAQPPSRSSSAVKAFRHA